MSESQFNLAYRDRFRRVIETENSEDAPVLNQETAITPDGSSLIIYRWTADEFTKLFSALSIGADLLWADEADAILWSLLKGVETPMNLCELVAECLQSGALDDSLASALSRVSPNVLLPLPEGEKSPYLNQNIGVWDDCNYANIYAFCVQIVELTDSLIVDLFERLESASNSVEYTALVLDEIPVLSEALEVTNFFQESVFESYLSAQSILLKKELADELFCIVQSNCYVTLNDAVDFFTTKAGKAFADINTLSALMLDFLGFPVAGSQPVYTLYGFIWGVVGFGGGVGIVNNLNALLSILNTLLNDENNDYPLDCIPPPETFVHTFDFRQSNALWRAGLNDPQRVTWQAGVGYTRGGYQNRLQIETISVYNFTLTSIEINLSQAHIVGSGGVCFATATDSYAPGQTVPSQWASYGLSFVVDGRLSVSMANYQTPSNVQPFPASLAIQSITIRGLGTNPFI